MTRQGQTQESVKHLSDRVKSIKKGPLCPWLGVDVTLGHREVVGAENTLTRTSERLRQHLHAYDTGLGSHTTLSDEFFEGRVFFDLMRGQEVAVGFDEVHVGRDGGEFVEFGKIPLRVLEGIGREGGLDQGFDEVVYGIHVGIVGILGGKARGRLGVCFDRFY